MKKRTLVDKIKNVLVTEDCCVDCMIEEIARVLLSDTSCNTEIKDKMKKVVLSESLDSYSKLSIISFMIDNFA